jgi:hypothetical protein
VSSLYVYKVRSDPATGNTSWGNWFAELNKTKPFVWGGEWCTKSPYSTRMFQEIAKGDLVLAWQIDRRIAVGVCEVTGFKYTNRGQELVLRWREKFDPPVKLAAMKPTNAALRNVRAFKPGFMGTLYDTTRSEAKTILKACGSSLGKAIA